MLGNLFAIMGFFLGCFIFWQYRRQAELARVAIKRKCYQLELQLVSVALEHHKFKTPEGRWQFHSIYIFEFSALGDDCYQDKLKMVGFQVSSIYLPPYRIE